MIDLFNPGREADIILLDYQCTLCANGDGRTAWYAANRSTGRSYTEWIAQEEMRDWLIPLFAGRRVILLTARKSVWQDVTLDRIRRTLDWQPDEWYFNPDGAPPPEHKERILRQHIFPRHGRPGSAAYLALESNRHTRAMYQRHGIAAIRIAEPIPALPLI